MTTAPFPKIPDQTTETGISRLEFETGKILNINKPVDWTSFDVVKKIRSHIKVKKVGHAGSLDPFATGVLLICTGKATKRVESLMHLEKEYLACMELGKTTDTYDRTGVMLTEPGTKHITFSDIVTVCQFFTGEIFQTPPMYSALKKNGRRLYELARRGEVVERTPRKVHIYRIELLDFQNPFLNVKVICSRGTYIRSLAFDIGEKLGCGAYLKDLTRTRIGQYTIDDAWSVSDFVVKTHSIL
ncbi:MAG: tRNA pseudouridine(55) synthase TruB [bacterium]